MLAATGMEKTGTGLDGNDGCWNADASVNFLNAHVQLWEVVKSILNISTSMTAGMPVERLEDKFPKFVCQFSVIT